MDKRAGIVTGAFSRHREILENTLDALVPEITAAAGILADAANKRRSVFICGNGGSAADSQHLATEWVSRYKKERDPLKAVALTTDTSALTAIGNDYGFEELFARQLKALAKPDDVLVAFTTSGQSKNILRAIAYAKQNNIRIIALTGEGGSGLRGETDVLIAIPSGETARIQEMHELIYHIWCECLDEDL